MKTWPRLLAIGLLFGSGCGEQIAARKSAGREEQSYFRTDATASPPAAKAEAPAAGEMMGGMAMGDADRPAAPDTAPPKAVPRKIIYNADVELTVDDFARAEQGIMRLVKESGGYLADSNVAGSPGSQRSGMWKVRVPVEGFESFVEAVIRLGELQRRQTNSQDVTEEFYDLEARIKNKKVEEARLVKHLEESTGKLKDILDVERELSRVREEVERQQGRLQLLANLASLTTVTIHVREWKGYIPAAAPTFATRVARTFRASVDQLARFSEGLVLAVVSVVPWLPVWGVLAALAWLVIRRLRGRSWMTFGPGQGR
jgi:hypothetical protein